MSITSGVWIRARLASLALALTLTGCRQGATTHSVVVRDSASGSAAISLCTADSMRPATAAPAGGLWAGEHRATGVRVAVLIGAATADPDRPRITRRIEALELRADAESLRAVTETASVKLELLPRFGRPVAQRDRPQAATTEPATAIEPARESEPAAVYPISRRTLLASYEPCAASGGEPRIRYLRRDEHGLVATDVMLSRTSAESAGTLR